MKFKLFRGFQNDGLPILELSPDSDLEYLNNRRLRAIDALERGIREGRSNESIMMRQRILARITSQYNRMLEARIMRDVFPELINNE
jgi:hypothetical protein